MAILHKHYQSNWDNGFSSQNAILSITPYQPEVLVAGTYNPDIPGNLSEFYYGRNYFWPGIKNLFVHDAPVDLARRDRTAPLSPALPEIFQLCERLKLSFCDLIDKTMHQGQPHYQVLPSVGKRGKVTHMIHYNGNQYNPIDDADLEDLDALGQVHWNTSSIIQYVQRTPSIQYIYFTRKPTGIWQAQWEQLRNHPTMQNRLLTNIYTPSGRRLRKEVMENLLAHWVHNINPMFGRLENAWLRRHNVTLVNF